MAREAREKALSVNERDFLLQALREEKRVDGRCFLVLIATSACVSLTWHRRPFDMRVLKIAVGPAQGEVTVLLGAQRSAHQIQTPSHSAGQTRVYCVVSAELGEPYVAAPSFYTRPLLARR